MNIYEKIQAIRVELEGMNIKMSGHNEFAHYDYFELDDFIKPLNALMQKHKMTAYPSFTPDFATLTAVDLEKPDDKVIITSPMGTANLKGCHDVQNIGATETYQRRYLYQALFDITEKDGINGTQGKDGKQDKKPMNGTVKSTPPQPQVSEKPFPGQAKQKQLTNYEKLCELITGYEADITPSDIKDTVFRLFGKAIKVNDLTAKQFDELYAEINGMITEPPI